MRFWKEEKNRTKLLKEKIKNSIFKDGIYEKNLDTMTNGTKGDFQWIFTVTVQLV